MTYKLKDILNEIVVEKISDDPYKYYRYIKPISKLLNVKVTDYMRHGSRSTIFTLSDGRILKLTNDTRDAAGLEYAWQNHPRLPVLKVYELYKYRTGEDALGNPYWVYVSINEKLDRVPTDMKTGKDVITAINSLKSWFEKNDIEAVDVHEGNVGLSKDTRTPLKGIVLLDPNFKGMNKPKNIPELK